MGNGGEKVKYCTCVGTGTRWSGKPKVTYIYDPHGGGVMKARVSDTKYSHVLVPVLVRIGPGGLRYCISSQFLVTPGGTAIDVNGIAPNEDLPQYIVSAGGTQGSVPRREPDSEPGARGSHASTSRGSRDSGI